MSTKADAGARVGESGSGRLGGIDRGTVARSLLVVALAVLLSVVLLPQRCCPVPPSGPQWRRWRARRRDNPRSPRRVDLATGALVGHVRSPVGSTASTDNGVAVEREWMRALMAPEVRLGVVSQDELEALAGTRTNARKAERVFAAETDLVRQIAREVVPRPRWFRAPAWRWRGGRTGEPSEPPPLTGQPQAVA